MSSSLADLLVAVAIAAAVAQWWARARLDLGPATTSVVLATFLLAPAVEGVLWPLSFAVVGGALAQAAAARRGVGRPDLLVGVLAWGWMVFWAQREGPRLVDGFSGASWAKASAVAVLVSGVVATMLARERRGLAGQRVFHYREVPVEGSRGAASSGVAGAAPGGEDAA